jgi:hypothetical protein
VKQLRILGWAYQLSAPLVLIALFCGSGLKLKRDTSRVLQSTIMAGRKLSGDMSSTTGYAISALRISLCGLTGSGAW